MAAAELAFEKLALALESTSGTAITNPTHFLHMEGMITPSIGRYRPLESRGIRAANLRNKIVRKGAEWEGEGPIDVTTLPVLLNMAVAPVTSPTTPGAAGARLWTFTPSMTAGNLKSATAWWGDPNALILKSPYAMIEELTISADASSEDGAMVSVSGYANFPVDSTTPPTYPTAILAGGLIVGQNMRVYIDVASAIGTTAVTGRVVSASHTIRTGTVPKYLAAGPTASLGFTRHGYQRVVGCTATVVLELADDVQYNLWEAGSTIKLRVQYLGDAITGETALYEMVQIDTYGPFDSFAWGDLEGANRTIELTIESEYDTTLGADYSIAVQNVRTTL